MKTPVDFCRPYECEADQSIVMIGGDAEPLTADELEEVCRRVNAHDALVAALEKIAVLSYGLLADDEARSTAVGIAKAALTAARGE